MVSLYSAMNGNGMAAERKAVEDYLNGGRWKLVGEFTEVESGKRAAAGTCMDNRRATVPSSEVKDAVEGGRLKAIWPQRREPRHNTERAHRCLAHRCERRVGVQPRGSCGRCVLREHLTLRIRSDQPT